MKHLAPLSAASLMMIAASYVTPPSADAQWQGVNEKKWAELIESDIRNKASSETICINSTNYATTSKDKAFKNWALSIAQKHCTEGDKQAEADAPIANEDEQCHLDSSEIFQISIGEKIQKQGKGCWSSFN